MFEGELLVTCSTEAADYWVWSLRRCFGLLPWEALVQGV